MIISASRRTDIPAFYSEWFFNRLHEKVVYVRNPFNPHQVSSISLDPENTEGIVFWTKDASPMIPGLKKLNDYPFYFQFTLNPYDHEIECGVPSKAKHVIPSFQRLSDEIGPERVIWRYDPIIISKHYSYEYHVEYFEKLARRLHGYTTACTFSFLDIYRNTLKHMNGLEIEPISEETMLRIAKSFSEIAASYDLKLQTCAEAIDLTALGIEHARCIDDRVFEKITGNKYHYSKDANQRSECGCMTSIDIGAYNCCAHGCRYCYATYSPNTSSENIAKHDPLSPLLIGNITADDVIKIRSEKRVASEQIHMNI